MSKRPGVTDEHWALAASDASLGVGHVWTNTACPAYASLNPDRCNCNNPEPRFDFSVTEVAYHRNGVSGEGFYVVACTIDGGDFVASCFFDCPDGETLANYPNPRIALLDPAHPMTPYRGDYFADSLLAACQEWSDRS